MKILVIGNGFDLAHHLPTEYKQFLECFKDIGPTNCLSKGLDKVRKGERFGGHGSYISNNYSVVVEKADIAQIRKMESILSNNVWAKYYAGCQAEIQGWIDFEKEMQPVFEVFKEVFFNSSTARMVSVDEEKAEAIIKINDSVLFKKAGLLGKYFYSHSNHVKVNPNYVGDRYGIFKEKLLDDLKNELDDFIEAFRIYLVEVVDRIPIAKDPVIKSLEPDAIISFNYTKTEQKYDNLKSAKSIHIHGTIDNKDSMVMGVEEVEDDPDNDFIYFVKYFQRIRRKASTEYKTFLEAIKPSIGVVSKNEVIFYGHSLDRTDKDIIKPFISHASKAKIYYYNEVDYERKVINLIGLFDREYVEDNMRSGRIEFCRCDGK